MSLPYRKDFLFPVRAVSRRVRKKFAELLQKAYDKGELTFPDDLAYLKNRSEFKRFLNKVAWEKLDLLCEEGRFDCEQHGVSWVISVNGYNHFTAAMEFQNKFWFRKGHIG